MLLMCQSESSDQDIEEILTQAGALKAENLQFSSFTQEGPNHPDTQNENLQSPARKLLDYFKYNNLSDSPSKVRNTLLVIVILITAATYQPALSPPGGTWQDDTIPSTTNNTTTTKRHKAGEAIMASNRPIAYSVFLLSNSIGFFMSLHMISVLTTAFPLKLELRISTIALSITYTNCMLAIAPNSFITFCFIGITFVMQFMIPCTTTLVRNYFKRSRNVSPKTSHERV
ncbi:Ankyrin repeat-containing protein [Artemisia annua]|uniref:Ankyrin repeat-containing protein n=1 Tax=Artemisia annua TaxID=35608 RepID=A0A2U1MGL0_ARTAN|nr:Ankyrin repeat-containing protein [Artemisia annua]